MSVHYLKTTASDLSVPGAHWDNEMSVGAPTANNISNNVGSGSTDIDYGFTPSGVPGVDGSTGDYSVFVHPNTAAGDLEMSVQLHRVNSSGTVQSSSSVSSEQTFNANRTFNFNALDLGTWAAGDRLRVDFRARSTASHGNSTWDVKIGEFDTRVGTPWNLAAAGQRVFLIT